MNKLPFETDDKNQIGALASSLNHTVRADLKAYLDGELTPLRYAIVRLHLTFCRGCREELRWLSRLGEDMRDLEQAAPSPLLRARIMANLPVMERSLQTSTSRVSSSGRSVAFRLAMSGALGLFIMGVGFAAIKFGFAHSVGQTTENSISPEKLIFSIPNKKPSRAIDNFVIINDINSPSVIIDETSRDATALTAKQDRAILSQKEHRLNRNIINWKIALKESQYYLTGDPKGLVKGETPQINLTLSVPDVDSAEHSLTVWARNSGFSSLNTNPPTHNSMIVTPPSATSVESSHAYPVGGSNSSDRTTIALTIPAKRMRELQPILQQIGAGKLPGQKVVTMSPADNPQKRLKIVKGQEFPQHTKLDTPGALYSQQIPDQVASRSNDGKLITVLIHLQE